MSDLKSEQNLTETDIGASSTQDAQKPNHITRVRRNMVRDITMIGVMSALAVVLVLYVRFPLLPGATFLEYDPADIPLFVIAFAFGPLPALVITGIVSAIQALTVSASSGFIGMLMHFAATGISMLLAGSIYNRKKTKKNAILALIVSSLAMVAVMVLMNIVFTPIFMGVPLEQVIGMLVPIIIPFNLIKATINSVGAFAVYKSVGRLFGDRMGEPDRAKVQNN